MKTQLSLEPRIDGPSPSKGRFAWLIMAMLAALTVITYAIYAPGIGGGFIFDDYPNIVDNVQVQPKNASLAALTAAAMSSPSSDLKRPLSSLTFAANVLAADGLSASGMKLTNVVIHWANGLLLYFLVAALFRHTHSRAQSSNGEIIFAGVITLAWLLAPINLTAVLYVVQRMESLGNLFVLAGLLGYTKARVRMQQHEKGFICAAAWMIVPTMLGIAAKETAVLLPLYTFFLELFIFRFRSGVGHAGIDRRFAMLYVAILGIPLAAGVVWLGPNLLKASSWATRDFTLRTRLLSECRIVIDYLGWTIVPLPDELSFYHDDFVQSTGWLTPITTLMSALAIAILAVTGWAVRHRAPLASLGIAWFFACHTLTGTVLPLELVYEHRNYFASIGVILALGAILSTLNRTPACWASCAAAALMVWAAALTATTAAAWGSPLGLAEELASRGPDSPRAQYELGRAYIIASHYQATSPFTNLAYAPLEHAAALPGSSILPQQALIFLNSRINRPVKDEWWRSMIVKLERRPATVQDESSLDALSRCVMEQSCHLDNHRLSEAMDAALRHPAPTGRMYAIAANFARNALRDDTGAYALQIKAVAAAPDEPAYRLALARMARDRGDQKTLNDQLSALDRLNVGGRLNAALGSLNLSSTEAGTTP